MSIDLDRGARASLPFRGTYRGTMEPVDFRRFSCCSTIPGQEVPGSRWNARFSAGSTSSTASTLRGRCRVERSAAGGPQGPQDSTATPTNPLAIPVKTRFTRARPRRISELGVPYCHDAIFRHEHRPHSSRTEPERGSPNPLLSAPVCLLFQSTAMRLVESRRLWGH